MINNNVFSREDTRAIKGIAVIMMLMHHLIAFPARYPVGFDGFKSLWKPFVEEGYLSTLGFNVRLCVAVFFFLGGYGLYKRWEAGKFSLMDSVISLFKSYWKVFIIFIPIAFLFFSHEKGENINELCTRYSFEETRDMVTAVIANFFALSDSLNSEWWFVQTYVCTMMLGTLFCILTKKNKHFIVDLFIVFTIDILIRSFFPAIANTKALAPLNNDFFYNRFFKLVSTASSFFAGIIFAKHDTLVRVKNKICKIPFKRVAALLGCIIIIYSRSFIIGDLLEIVYSSLFVVCLSVFFDGVKPLKKIFAFVGSHSTNMWLIHGFYCYYFLEATHLVYSTNNVWIDLLILVLISLASSVLLEFIYDKINYISNRIKNRKSQDKPKSKTESQKETVKSAV